MGSIINPSEKQTWAITAQGITVMGKTKSYNTYEEMLRSPDPGLINYVTDASGDPTVNSGFAVYRYANGIFTKVYEGEMMDPDLGMTFEWSKIVNGPTSTPTDIDAAVEKTQPMEIQKDDTGRIVGLAVNGILLATEEQITELEGKTAGALHFKGVVENKEALPTEGNVQGDVYVDKEGKEYVYVEGTGFEEFGSITDLTNYYTKDEITAILATYLPLTNGVFSGLVYMEEAATTNAAQNIIVLGSNAIMNRVSIGQQDPTGFDADKLYSFKYFEAGPLGMKGFVDYLKAKGVSEAITSEIRTNGVQIQDTGKKISDIPFYQTFQNPNDDAPRKTIQLANHDTISGIKTDGSGVNIAMVSKWDKVDLGSANIQLNLNSSDRPTLNDEDPIVVQSDLADYAKFEPNTFDPSRPNRKALTLKNDDNICGYTTAGGSVNLAMVSKWDVADFGSTSVHMNLNSKDAITVNDTDTVLTSANYKQFITQDGCRFTAEDEAKLDGIEAGAQVNVKPDWNAEAGSAAEILNKPEIPDAYDDSEVKAEIASIKSDYATKEELSAYKVNLGAGTANTFVITNADGTIKASEYKLGGSSIAPEPNATTAATEQAVKTFVTNSVATKADTASFDVPSNIILVSSSVSDKEENNTVCLDGYLGIVGTNTFATLTEAVAAASANDTIRIIGGQYIESPTINKALKIYGVNNPSFAGRFAFSGDLSGTVIEGVEINYAADANDTISHSVQYSTIGITPTGDLDGFIIRDCRIRTSGMATGIYVVGNDSDVVIENCEVIGGARNDGKTVASIVFQGNTHTAPVVKDCYLYGSVYFNSTTVSATVEGNTFCMVDSSAVSFAKKLSGNVIVRNNEFLSDGVNNAFKFNGNGTVGTNTGVDFTDLESLVIVDNYVAVNESFVYMQAQTTAWDASKVTVENNRLFFRAGAVMFKNEDSSVTYEFSASNVVLNEATVQFDDSELQAAIDAVEKTADKANGNVVSMSDRLASLEAQIVSLKQTDVAAVTSSADLAQADKDLIITIAEPITGTTTVEGKSIEVKQLTANNATTVFKTEGDVTMKNLTTTGDLPKATANAQIRIVSGDYVRITDSAIDQTGYNAIEIGLGTGSGPSATKSIVIDNVKFNSTLTNNAISIFATEDGSVITISNCTFTKCSNPVRLSNATGGKVTINLVNCEFTEWDSDPAWAGILIMQDYTSGSAEAIRTNNLFGPDKVTINVINCTHAGEKITMPEDIATVCGTNDAATQLFYIWSNEEGLVAYDADRYPVINIQ